MIAEFLNYKRKKIEDIINSENISDIEKKEAEEEYYEFFRKYAVVDEHGRLVIDHNVVKELMTVIKEEKIPLIMNENDKMISVGAELPNSESYKGNLFTSLSDIVAVHITPVPPVDDTIRTKESTGVMNNMIFVDPSTRKQHTVPYLVGNDTIHFTLNCVVHNHESGNDWNSYKYGVLIDFSKLNKTKILDVKSEDTYIDGDAKLESDYFLFCPLGEREKIAEDNPRATIIEYNGITLADAISCMIVFSGRKLEPYGTYGWGKNFEYGSEVSDVYELENFVVSEGYPVLKGQFGNALHSETKYMARRMWKREYEALISLIKYNQENNIHMPDDIALLVMMYGGAYGLPGTVPVSLKDYKEVVFPILEKYGYYVDDSLFEGVDVDSDMKIIYYPQNGEEIPVISCPNWEIKLRNRVVNILKNDVKSNNISDNNEMNGLKI